MSEDTKEVSKRKKFEINSEVLSSTSEIDQDEPILVRFLQNCWIFYASENADGRLRHVSFEKGKEYYLTKSDLDRVRCCDIIQTKDLREVHKIPVLYQEVFERSR
jgi:hypothetical protein